MADNYRWIDELFSLQHRPSDETHDDDFGEVWLSCELWSANEVYQRGQAHAREGAILQMRALLTFLYNLPCSRDRTIFAPLEDIVASLECLGLGIVRPLLETKGVRGGTVLIQSDRHFHYLLSLIVRAQVAEDTRPGRVGAEHWSKARSKIAAELHRRGYRQQRANKAITAETLGNWEKESRTAVEEEAQKLGMPLREYELRQFYSPLLIVDEDVQKLTLLELLFSSLEKTHGHRKIGPR